MSQIYTSAIIALLAQVLPMLDVQIGSDQLTSAISTIVTIVSGLWILVRRYRQGDITISGRRRA